MVEDVIEVVVRPATRDDADEIARVHIASWRQAYSGVVPDDYLAQLDASTRAEAWRSLLDDAARGMWVWVAVEDDHVLGFASLGASRDEDADRSTMEIYTIYLEPAAWGRGVARELMRTVLATVPEGASVTLWALDANDRARHFHRRHGFAPDGVDRVEEIGGRPLREIRYRRG